MIELLRDLRHAFRSLRATPAFTGAAVLTLALGIGANAALFSVVDAVLLRPLPFAEPERVMVVWRTTPDGPRNPHSAADFLDLQRQARSFSALAGYRQAALDFVSPAGEARRVEAIEVTRRFFDVFGVPASLGRALQESDRPGEPLVVIGDALWRSALAADPSVVGRALRLGSRSMTVVGVMPPSFAWPLDAEAWVLAEREVPTPPLAVPGDLLQQRGLSYFDVAGRLAPAATRESAAAELRAIAAQLAREYPDNDSERGYHVVGAHEHVTGDARRSLLLLLAIVGLVLAIAAANVANLLLARGVARRRELAVRASLGASPAALAWQALAESALLGAGGAALGLAIAEAGLSLLLKLVPAGVPRVEQVGVNGNVLLFTTAVALGVSLLFGLAPALQAARGDLLVGLRAGGRGVTGPGRRLRQVLVGAQLALSLVALAGAFLLARSFVLLDSVEPGFDTRAVVTVGLDLPTPRYPAPVDRARFYRGLVERLSANGRYRAAAGFPEPFGDGAGSAAPLRRADQPADPRTPMALLGSVTPGYFGAMHIPLHDGRDFSAADVAGERAVVVISRSAAERFWPGESPLGARVTLGSDTPFEVIGIAGDVRRKGLDTPAEPTVYLPYARLPLPFFHLVLSGAEPSAMAADARAALRELDPELPFGPVRTLEDVRRGSIAQPRFRTVLLGLFAGLALALAVVGLYGVVSESTARRRRELGVRLALGARPHDLMALVLADGLRPSLIGLLLGLPGALALGRAASSLLYGVAPSDPVTLASVSACLVAVAALASYLPARRATKLDPTEVMRSE